jgi:FtsH-binding integral membrane protein
LFLKSILIKQSSYHKTISIMLSLIITLVVSLGITILSLQTKYDFTSCFHYMLMVTLILTFVSSGAIIVALWLYDDIYSAFYAALGALVVILCITVDVQMLISGKRYIKLTTNDYVYVCLQLYLDLFYFLFFSCEKN